MDKTKAAALRSLMENFFLPRAEEDASDEVHAFIESNDELRFSLQGRRGKYVHTIDEAKLLAFKGDVHELIDFLSAEMSTAVHRYRNGSH